MMRKVNDDNEFKGKGFQAKQEGETVNDWKFSKASTSSRQRSGFKNPRIVRVSRSFGGKDRHSKVCTIRGLRDRRIRLSVPTAIQLYDLQDRLGLNQPSKVIDWLLDVTKHDIDKLPPLQLPPEFAQFHHPMLTPHLGSNESSLSSLSPFFNPKYTKNLEDQASLIGKSKYWDIDAEIRAKSMKELQRGANAEKGKWIKTREEEEEENQTQMGNSYGEQISQKILPISNLSSIPNLLNNAIAYNHYYSDPSYLSLSQLGNYHGMFHSQMDINSSNVVSNSIPPSGSQLFLCQSSASDPPTLFPSFPSYLTTTQAENHDPRSFNNVQMLSSSSSQVFPNSIMPTLHSFSSSLKSFQGSINLRPLHSQNNGSPSKDD